MQADWKTDLKKVFSAILKEFRQRYVLAFTPKGVATGNGWHTLEVKVKRPGTTVRARSRYSGRTRGFVIRRALTVTAVVLRAACSVPRAVPGAASLVRCNVHVAPALSPRHQAPHAARSTKHAARRVPRLRPLAAEPRRGSVRPAAGAVLHQKPDQSGRRPIDRTRRNPTNHNQPDGTGRDPPEPNETTSV